MVSLGIDLAKDHIFWSALDGTRGAPNYILHGVENYQVDDYRSELIEKSEAIFLGLINQIKPKKISYRLSLDAGSSDQIAYLHFPVAILLRLCRESKTPVKEYFTRSFTHKLFGIEKIESPAEAVDRLIGEHPPHWRRVKNATMASWANLDV